MKNNLKTAALLAGLGVLCMAVGSFWGQQGLIIGLLIGLAMVGFSYWGSDKLAIRAAKGVEVTEAQMPEYYAIVRDLATRADIPMPKLYVSPSPQPNAFATGRNPQHAAVCINQGLLPYLEWDEIKGVLAHEISHVRNRDILTSSVAAAIAMGIAFVGRMAMFSAIFGGGGGGRNRNGGNAIGDLVMIILAPMAAMVIQMAISRSREYEADAAGARLLGTGEPLARALEKLEVGATRIPSLVGEAQASVYIVNPLRDGSADRGRQGPGGRQPQQRKRSSMFSTHPPTADRVARLRSGQWQFG